MDATADEGKADDGNVLRWHLLDRKRAELAIAQAFGLLQGKNIKCFLIKGWVSAQFYPYDRPRSFGDIDIAVAPEDFEKAVRLIDEEDAHRLGIDLHRSVRHLDSLSFDDLYRRSKVVLIEGVEVRVPCSEDHLRIVAVHWLTDGGEFRERLWDIHYAVANRPDDFDWDKCLNAVDKTRRSWVVISIGLAHKYLGLKIEGLPIAGEARDVPEWITKCVESAWNSDVRLRPLHVIWRDPSMLLKQIGKRIPPNPIQASIDMNAPFDDSSRLYYQIGSVFKRILPSVNRIIPTLFRRGGRA